MYLTLDQKLLLTLQKIRRPWLSKFFIVLTATGTGKAWFIFVLIMNILHQMGIHVVQFQNNFMNALYAPLLAWILSKILKRLFSRGRPSPAILGFKKLISPPTCGGFHSVRICIVSNCSSFSRHRDSLGGLDFFFPLIPGSSLFK